MFPMATKPNQTGRLSNNWCASEQTKTRKVSGPVCFVIPKSHLSGPLLVHVDWFPDKNFCQYLFEMSVHGCVIQNRNRVVWVCQNKHDQQKTSII